jgi:hypothetical protein
MFIKSRNRNIEINYVDIDPYYRSIDISSESLQSSTSIIWNFLNIFKASGNNTIWVSLPEDASYTGSAKIIYNIQFSII